jgi:hypothetical protein
MARKNQQQAEMPNVSRTSSGLRDALFDELDDLRNGRTNPTKANAVSKIASSIISTVEMELEVHRIMSKADASAVPAASLPSFALGAKHD